MEADIKRLARRQAGDDSDEEEDGGRPSKKTKRGQSVLESELARYRAKSSRSAGGKKKKDEGDILARLDRFKGKLKRVERDESPGADAPDDDPDSRPPKSDANDPKADRQDDEDEEPMDVDTDIDFLSQRVYFPKSHDNTDETARAEHDYEVIDPRVRGAAAKEAESDRLKRKSQQATVGRVFRRDGQGGRDGGYRDRGGDRERGGERDREGGRGGNDGAPRKSFGKDAVRDRPRERDNGRDNNWDPGFGKRSGGGW